MKVVLDYFGAYAAYLAQLLEKAFSGSYPNLPDGTAVQVAPSTADYKKIGDAVARVLRSCDRVAEREIVFCPLDAGRAFCGITVAGMTAGGLEHMNQAIDALAHSPLEKLRIPHGHRVRFMPDNNWPEKLLTGSTEGLRPL